MPFVKYSPGNWGSHLCLYLKGKETSACIPGISRLSPVARLTSPGDRKLEVLYSLILALQKVGSKHLRERFLSPKAGKRFIQPLKRFTYTSKEQRKEANSKEVLGKKRQGKSFPFLATGKSWGCVLFLFFTFTLTNDNTPIERALKINQKKVSIPIEK